MPNILDLALQLWEEEQIHSQDEKVYHNFIKVKGIQHILLRENGMWNFLPVMKRIFFLMGAPALVLLLPLSNSTAGAEDKASADPPPVFQPNEIQHGFAEYETLPDFSHDNNPAPHESYSSSSTIPSIDQKPGGLFQSLDFAESVEEDRTIRRGHMYVPVNSSTTFSPQIPSVYLVFSVHKHLSSYQVIGRLFHESGHESQPSHLVDEESAELATEDESGFLKFFPPEGTWQSGRYRVDIYVGYIANAVNKMGSMHFTVSSASTPPSAPERSGG